MTNPVRKALLDAAKTVMVPGAWCQHWMFKPTTAEALCYIDVPDDAEQGCLLGHLCHASPSATVFIRARALLYEDIEAGRSIIRWNDTPGRTAAEVAALLRKAAAKVKP